MHPKLKTVLKWIGNIAVVLLIAWLFDSALWGIIGLCIFIIVQFAWQLWKERETVMAQLSCFETVIFGKPLDKDLWDKGELKQTKVQPYWKGKKMQVENKHMATFFFLLSLIFFGFFIYTRYTMNAIMFFFCLILSVSFKTWSIQRENTELLEKILLVKP